MNLFGLSPGELLLIMMVALVVLGPEKLPETAGSIGKWIREFRRATEELTAQFAAENPLAELQRAFSLADEPATTVADESEVVEETETVMAPSVETAPLIAAPIADVPTPIRSDYFTRPVYSPGIAPVWTHGAVEERSSRRPGRFVAIERSVALEWVHGAPIPSPSVSNGHEAELAPSTGLVPLTSEMISEISVDHQLPAPSEEVERSIESEVADVTEPDGKEAEKELVPVSTVSGDSREGQRT